MSTTDMKLGMSLDEISNLAPTGTKTRNRRKKSAASTGTAAATAIPATSDAPKRKNKRRGKQSASTEEMQVEATTEKVVKSVGAGKAKRAAVTNQKRGINLSGKATPAAVKTAQNNEGKKQARRKLLAPAAGLKISFKPSELGKTTEKAVADQIKGALSKSVIPGRRRVPRAQPAQSQAGGRVVISPRPGQGGGRRTGGRGGAR